MRSGGCQLCGVRPHGLNPRDRIVAPRMWRTYRTLRFASCVESLSTRSETVDGLAVRAAVWLGGGGKGPCEVM